MESDKLANWSTFNGFYSTELFANKTIEIVLRHDSQKPRFMYLPFQAVHGLVQAPDDYIKQTNSSDKNNRDIIYEDNGGPNKTGASNWPLKGYKGDGWEGSIRSVGFVHSNLLSNRVTGTVFKEVMHVTDWFPMFLNLARGTYNDSRPLDGYDQWHSLKYGTQGQRQEILHDILSGDIPMQPFPNKSLSLTRLRRASIRIGKWKFLKEFNTRRHAADQFDQTEMAYLHNIDEDPEEKINLLEENPAVVDRMVNRLKFYWKEMVPGLNAAIDPRANPRYRRGFWEPWVEYIDIYRIMSLSS